MARAKVLGRNFYRVFDNSCTLQRETYYFQKLIQTISKYSIETSHNTTWWGDFPDHPDNVYETAQTSTSLGQI